MRPRTPILDLAVAAAALAATAATQASEGSKRAIDFDREVRPILAAKCFTCHGPDAEARKAGLRLDTFAGSTAALKNGVRAIVPGDAAASTILARVTHPDPSKHMPPDGREPLTTAEVDTIRRWIDSGAEYTAPWAFQPMRAAAAPAVRDISWPRGEIDRFVLASREAYGLAAPADIDAAALLRRASFDLRGVPPSETEVRAFLADPSDAVFAAFVDQALASPDFGERWGRHWLDLARYAESLGHEFDYDIPEAWRYRDYVIEAFNADLRPARFVAEQIAGDLLDARPALGVANAAPIGTAWWFLGPATHAPVDVRQDEADRIAGKVDVAGRSLFGLSIACARCHDHKFDPIPAKDFYALAGVARNTRRVEGFLDTDPQAGPLADGARCLRPAMRRGSRATRRRSTHRPRRQNSWARRASTTRPAVALDGVAPAARSTDRIRRSRSRPMARCAWRRRAPSTARVSTPRWSAARGRPRSPSRGATCMCACAARRRGCV
jgi:cytochrome c553